MKIFDEIINFIGIIAVIVVALAIGAYFGYAEAVEHAQNNYILIPKP